MPRRSDRSVAGLARDDTEAEKEKQQEDWAKGLGDTTEAGADSRAGTGAGPSERVQVGPGELGQQVIAAQALLR